MQASMTMAEDNLVLDTVLQMQARLPDSSLSVFRYERDPYRDLVARFDLVGRRRYSTVVKTCDVWPELERVPVHATVYTVETPIYILMSWSERSDRDVHVMGFVKRLPHLLVHISVEDDEDPDETVGFLIPFIRSILDHVVGERIANRAE